MTSWADSRDGARYCCTTYRTQNGPRNPYGCGCNQVAHRVLEPLVMKYLDETGQALSGLAEGPGLGPLYRERSDTLDRLRDVRGAVERYLYERLSLYFPFEQHEDHRVFTVDWPDRTEVFRLPGFDGSPAVLEELCSLAEHHEKREGHRRLAELRDRYEELYRSFKTAPTEGFRRRLAGEVAGVEAELTRLEAELKGGLAHQLRAVIVQLASLARRVSEAARAVASTQGPARKAAALRRVLAAVYCDFEFAMKGSQRQSRLVRVRFVPQLGDEVSIEAPLSDEHRRRPY
jgi:hypothetical protein